jgi:tetratricopeptide (TPR) repeat protein
MSARAGWVALSLFLFTTTLSAQEKWWEAYKLGVSLVNQRNYKGAAESLQRAIAVTPAESPSVRAGNQIITYVPHFWLGIAKFNLGDVDGALREWKISEEQGVITRTEYYANLKDWVARANTEKERLALAAASGPKKAADTAINRALALQVDALSAGGDRTESYRNAQRKLQEALAQFRGAGADIARYRSAEATAGQAITLFTAAAEEGKKLKAAQAKPPAPKPPVNTVVVDDIEVTLPTVTTTTQKPVEPAPVPVRSQASVDAELALQQYRRNIDAATRAATTANVQQFLRNEGREAEALRRELESAKSDVEYVRVARRAADRDQALPKKIAEMTAPPPAIVPGVEQASGLPPPEPLTQGGPEARSTPPELESAYRAFAAGNLDAAEQLLTTLLDRKPTAEAYVLRGCARYTRAMLSRAPSAVLNEAASDFKAALSQNANLRLDTNAFSPKLVAFFEQVRNGR